MYSRVISLDKECPWLDTEGLKEALKSAKTALTYRPLILDICSSTQDVARDLAIKGEDEGVIVISRRMSEGRGRFGRRWISPEGGLWFTILFRPNRLEGLQLMTLAGGLAVAEGIYNALGVRTGLKWPNDVLLDSKKVSGILSEASITAGHVDYVLLGVGINSNNDIPRELSSIAISLKEILGRCIDNVSLLVEVVKAVDKYYFSLSKGDVEVILDAWRSWSVTLKKVVKVVLPDGRWIIGKAIDLGDDGSLVVDVDGARINVTSGEVYHLR
jgi:BirA family biotin operon repressor/biotin-[acetyl-CoA-carboxylase] ligase